MPILNHLLIIPDGDRRYARREYLAGLFNESLKAFRETLSALSKRDAELLEERIEEYNQTGRDPFYDDRENFMDILYSGKIFVPQGYLLNSYKKGGEVFSSLMKWILQNDITKVLSIYALQRRNLERPDEQVEIMLKVEAEIFKLWADNKEMMSSCKVKFVGNQKIFDLYKDKKILRGAIDYYVNSIKLLETKSSGKKLKVYVLAPYDRVWEINQAIVSGRFNPARLVVKEEVDLIIRAGNAKTPTSGALPYQVAYSQFSSVPEYFPDFTVEILQKGLEEYESKERDRTEEDF